MSTQPLAISPWFPAKRPGRVVTVAALAYIFVCAIPAGIIGTVLVTMLAYLLLMGLRYAFLAWQGRIRGADGAPRGASPVSGRRLLREACLSAAVGCILASGWAQLALWRHSRDNAEAKTGLANVEEAVAEMNSWGYLAGYAAENFVRGFVFDFAGALDSYDREMAKLDMLSDADARLRGYAQAVEAKARVANLQRIVGFVLAALLASSTYLLKQPTAAQT